MASIGQLEKLVHIQKVFAANDTLEAAVAIERVEKLIVSTEHLLHQRSFLREERRLIRTSTDQLEAAKASIECVQKPDWLHASIVSVNQPETKRIQLSVGGMLFETTEEVLLRDKGSVLAQLCGPAPPVQLDKEGYFQFDRDWWIFRHIMLFLRDGMLPSDHKLLAHLYREANFWNLKSLQWAIEEEKLHLRSENILSEEDKAEASWWKKTPTWWEKEEPKDDAPPAATDWWVDESYKGKDFSREKMPEYPEKEE